MPLSSFSEMQVSWLDSECVDTLNQKTLLMVSILSHVGVTVLQLMEGCSSDDDVFSCRRWNMKYFLSNGITLFERLRQNGTNGASSNRDKKASREDRQSMYGGKDELLIEMQRLEQNRQMRMSQLEAYIDEQFKFVASVRAAKMETESVLR